jgi:predicted Zn-dependent protease
MKCPYCGSTFGYYYWIKEKCVANFGNNDAETFGSVKSTHRLYCQSCNHALSKKQAGLGRIV